MQYWLFKWLDEQYVQTIEDAERVLSYELVVDDLRQQALIVFRQQNEPNISNTISVLAGRGLDLSEQVDCIAPMCGRCQADHLFRHIWHYFDHIVIQDAVAEHLVNHWDCWGSSDKEDLESHKRRLLSIIENLLYLRKIGAEPLVKFQQKPSPCKKHWQQHAREAGLDHIVSGAEDLASLLAKEAQISFEDGHYEHASFIHPAFEIDHVHVDLNVEQVKEKKEEEIRRIVAEEVVRRFVAYLTTDVLTAKKLKTSLGATIRFHSRLLQDSEVLSTGGVAFNIELPVLQGVPVETLIKIRQDEHEHFARFQDTLRLAISERIKASQTGDASQIAAQIRQDIIEPELRRIRDRLAASEKVLQKKTAVGIFLTFLTTTCGLLAGVSPPLAVTGGLAPLITMAGQAASKHLEEKHDVELENMYFLWKAVEHQH